MKRILPVLLALTLFVTGALAETVYSRSIILPVDPDETPETGAYNITYNPGKGGGTETADPDGGYAKGAKVAVKSESDLSFTAPTDADGNPLVFSGWSTSATAKKANPAYAPGRTVKISKNLTLYAVWVASGKEKTTKLIYHRNTGSSKKVTEKYMDGETVTLTDAAALGWTPAKKTFLGWSMDSDAVKPAFEAGDKVVVTGSKNHLYAVWQSDGAHLAVNKYITNKKWDKNGELILFRAGDTINFNIEVTNTGSVTLGKVLVYDLLIEQFVI